MRHDLRISIIHLMHAIAVAAVLTCMSALAVTAQVTTAASGSALMGTEYYVSFMPNEDSRGAAPRFMGLMITSEVPTTGSILIRKSDGSTEVKPFETRPGEITSIPIDRSLTLFYEDGGPSAHITSRAPVAVFVLNSLFQSSGAYAAVPVEYWGNSYMPLTLPNADRDRVGQLAVIAAEKGTLVTITPSVRTTYRDARQDIVVTLNAGETFFIQARSGSGDLSATEISATKPIGVISGHVRTPITADGSVDKWASHTAAMLLPDSRWGTEYLTVPMRAGGTADRFRMVSAGDGTTIKITHHPKDGSPEETTVTLNRGDIFDASSINGKPISGAVRWSASKPVMLMQMRTGGDYGDAQNSPAVIMPTSMDKFPTMAPFAALPSIGSSEVIAHTLTVIARGNGTSVTDPSNPINSLLLDGRPLSTNVTGGLVWTKADNDYYFTRIPVNAGPHLLSSQEGYPFNAIVEGNAGTQGDFYTWQVPSWIPRTEADTRAPYVVSHEPRSGGIVTARFSDRTGSYFSGIAEAKVVTNQNWKLKSSPFSVPSPDDDADVTFETTVDPSGPLYVMLRDRNGNQDTVTVFEGFCNKSAYAARSGVLILTNRNVGKTDSVMIAANPCGDASEVVSVDLGTGQAANYLSTSFNTGSTAFTIPAYGNVMMYFTVPPSNVTGIFTTDVTVTLSDATIVIPVRLEIGTSSAGTGSANARTMDIAALPNPFHAATRITFGRELNSNARLTITDALGRAVYHMGGSQLQGQASMLWQGIDDKGALLPAGPYFVSVADGEGRAVISTMLVR